MSTRPPSPDISMWVSPIPANVISSDGSGSPHVRLVEGEGGASVAFDVAYVPPQLPTPASEYANAMAQVPREEDGSDSTRYVAIESGNAPIRLDGETTQTAEQWLHETGVRAGFYGKQHARELGFLGLIEVEDGTLPHEFAVGSNVFSVNSLGLVLATSRVIVARAFDHLQQGR